MPKKKSTLTDLYSLRLYVAANTPRSVLALANLRRLCEEHLAGRYRLEVIDLVANPRRAKDDEILAVPTLVRKLPVPIRKFIGNLSNPERLLVDIDNLSPLPAPFLSGK
jgi:circadian clock protein KaiB